MASSLVLEVNIVNFPEYQPSKGEGEGPVPWDNETKRNYFHQEAQVHMIKLGPVDQELLDMKLTHMELGVELNWDEKAKEYSWDSGKDLKPLPHKFIIHLLAELKKVGFAPPDYHYPDSFNFENGIKKIWILDSKF